MQYSITKTMFASLLNRCLKCSAIMLCLFIAACSSGIKRSDMGAAAIPVANAKYKEVTIKISDEAKTKLTGVPQFNHNAMRFALQRAMEAQGLIPKNTEGVTERVEIMVRDIRMRSNASAIMFGFMAGSDIITSDILVKDATDNSVKKFEVTVSSALGGLAGGLEGERLDWLYKKFAEMTVNELMGKPSE